MFGISLSYKIDESVLLNLYFKKQALVHPDIDESKSDESAVLNLAYKVLSDPIDRARYFLEINGKSMDSCVGSANELFQIREKYDSLSSSVEKKEFIKKYEDERVKLITALEESENNLTKFQEIFVSASFISSFLKKATADVNSRN
ncbi:MAG: hypothetical protein LBF57_01420 [Holosporaceae bacterium]|nr:hypothetical protein [Holosporaceae bacterium]